MPPLRALLCLLPGLLCGQGRPDGAELYHQYCAACHGVEGRGIPNAFPPLAGADFLVRHREKALRAPLEGLKERIEVNGASYNGWMPPVVLDDAQLTAVFNHIFTSFGNNLPTVTIEEIAALRARTKYPTHAQLRAALSPDTLPAAPAGWKFTVAAPLDFQPTRLANHPDGRRVLILASTTKVGSTSSATRATRRSNPSSTRSPSGGPPRGRRVGPCPAPGCAPATTSASAPITTA